MQTLYLTLSFWIWIHFTRFIARKTRRQVYGVEILLKIHYFVNVVIELIQYVRSMSVTRIPSLKQKKKYIYILRVY